MNTLRYLSFSLLIMLSCLACEKDYVEPTSLIDGFSFEEEPIQFSSFSSQGDDYDLSWTNEDAFDGEHSLKMTSNRATNQSFAFWNLAYADFEPGKPFNVKVRVKTVDMEGNGGMQVNMFARSKDRTSNISSGIGKLVNDTNGEWQTIEVSLDSSPNASVGVVDIYFLFNRGSTGTAYWDKLEIYTGL